MVSNWAADICNKLIATGNGRRPERFDRFTTDQFNELIDSGLLLEDFCFFMAGQSSGKVKCVPLDKCCRLPPHIAQWCKM